MKENWKSQVTTQDIKKQHKQTSTLITIDWLLIQCMKENCLLDHPPVVVFNTRYIIISVFFIISLHKDSSGNPKEYFTKDRVFY